MITLSESQWRLDVRKQNHDSDGVCISDLILHRFFAIPCYRFLHSVSAFLYSSLICF